MKISQTDVRHVARLARLELDEDEVASLTPQLDQILAYIDKLNELDTTAVPPTTHALAVENAFREDEVRPSIDRDAVLAGAPRTNGESFVVPRVI